MKNRILKRGLILLLLLAVAAAATGIVLYRQINAPAFAIDQPVAIYIDGRMDYSAVRELLIAKARPKNIRLFDRLAHRMKYPRHIKTGKYVIRPDLSYLDAIRMLRSRRQTAVMLTFNNLRRKSDLADRIAEQVMFSSKDLLSLMDDPATAATFGLDTATILTLFIPNTYAVYWDSSADQFLQRMKKEHSRFWDADRLAKAQALRLSPTEVSILASIVEEETAAREEYPIIAGLYLNRLQKGMPLQADPTVKFAVGDAGLKRILNSHLLTDSPYNTYRHTGLPPGPIRVPSIPAIDGVLNCERHGYLYMCAKEDFSGTHRFASSLKEHNVNAGRYREALNRLNIK
jgi:UPF0755 protein